jgi:hypothetical protein
MVLHFDFDGSLKTLSYFAFLNLGLFFLLKNSMNGFIIEEKTLTVYNKWRFSYHHEIELATVQKAYFRTEHYGNYIVLVLNERRERVEFKTSRLSKSDWMSLVETVNNRRGGQ